MCGRFIIRLHEARSDISHYTTQQKNHDFLIMQNSFQLGQRSRSSPITIIAAPLITTWGIYRCTSARDGAEKRWNARPLLFRLLSIPWRLCRTPSASCRTKLPLRIRQRSPREPLICIIWQNCKYDPVSEIQKNINTLTCLKQHKSTSAIRSFRLVLWSLCSLDLEIVHNSFQNARKSKCKRLYFLL